MCDDCGEEERLNRDQALGALMLVGSVLGIILYGWLVYSFPIIVLQVTAFVAAVGVLGILAWIGWTMATTPPLEPIEPELAVPAIEEETPKPSETPHG